jgi:prevent-host-death family protein
MNGTSTLSVSQLRQHIAQAIDLVVNQKQATVILQRSQPKAILVDYDYYTSLEETALDVTDTREARRAKKEKRVPFSSYLKRRWGQDGV